MDLVYADKQKEDVGILQEYNFDLAYGTDENDFEITVPTSNHVCEEDYLVYIEGTENGGIIDAIEVQSENRLIKYSGRTFHGILEHKIIAPDEGQNYYTVSGDANEILQSLINRLDLSLFFVASKEKSVQINNYQFERYVDSYKGIRKMLNSVGHKLVMTLKNKMVILAAVPIVTYEDEGLDSDRIAINVKKTYNRINHLICLGGGELKDRMVIHLYLDEEGNVSTEKTFSGIEEITATYDYANVESEEELIKSGTEKLKESDDFVNMSLAEGFNYDIDDVITSMEYVTGIKVTRPITKKIVTITKNRYSVEYKVGD